MNRNTSKHNDEAVATTPRKKIVITIRTRGEQEKRLAKHLGKRLLKHLVVVVTKSLVKEMKGNDGPVKTKIKRLP